MAICSVAGNLAAAEPQAQESSPTATAEEQPVSTAPRTEQRLKEGKETTIVCFGDSVTGIYYHTGSRRAYPELLQIAVQKAYRYAKVTVVNAGISGHTTQNALARIDKDVLAHKPNLVTVMFGLNDMVRVPPEEFQANLKKIIDKCQEADAEVILCTPNAIIENSGRPIKKLEEYCELIRVVGKEKNVPVADINRSINNFRLIAPHPWRMTMSDEIHPNLAGHMMMAKIMLAGITQKSVSVVLSEFPTLAPRLEELLTKARSGQPVKVLVAVPAKEIFEQWLKQQVPDGKFEVVAWEAPGKQTLAAWTADAKERVRPMKPDFVLLCPPPPSAEEDKEAIIYNFSWLMNWSLNFGPPSWDCVVVHPNVFSPLKKDVSRGEKTFETIQRELESPEVILRELVQGQDLMLIERKEGDERPAAEIIESWFTEQLKK